MINYCTPLIFILRISKTFLTSDMIDVRQTVKSFGFNSVLGSAA